MIFNSLVYVTSAFMFWESIFMTVGCGILIGMALHNGDVKGATKAVISLVPLMLLISAVSYFRVSPNIVSGIETYKTYAGILTSLFVGSAYIVGFIVGAILLRRLHLHA